MCKRLGELRDAMAAYAAGFDAALLSAEDAGRAVAEASGGVRLETVAAIAATGVDLISVGALTHSAPALDISLDIVAQE